MSSPLCRCDTCKRERVHGFATFHDRTIADQWTSPAPVPIPSPSPQTVMPSVFSPKVESLIANLAQIFDEMLLNNMEENYTTTDEKIAKVRKSLAGCRTEEAKLEFLHLRLQVLTRAIERQRVENS